MKTTAGFTLIELLIVMMVIGIALSLVGPLTLQQFSRAETISDREKLFRVIEQARYDSFVLRQSAELQASGQSIILFRNQQQVSWSFEHLSFPEQTIQLNAHGFWQQPQLNWLEQTNPQSLQLNPDNIEQNQIVSAPLAGAYQ